MKFDNAIFIKDIRIETIGDKLWLAVYFDNGTKWIPALIEQALVAQKVAQCERTKYPNLDHDAAALPMEFLRRAIEGECVCALAFEKKFSLGHTGAYKRWCVDK